MSSSDFEAEKALHSDDVLSHIPKPLNTEKAEEDVPDNNGPVDDSTSEYPQGIRLTVIIVSLMLSTFLVALDNASRRKRYSDGGS